MWSDLRGRGNTPTLANYAERPPSNRGFESHSLRHHSLRHGLSYLRAGQIATPAGPLPTVMGADTTPVAVVITDTVPSPKLVT